MEKWTYEKCKEIASQFKTRQELKEKYYQVHYKIYKKRWYELLSHMERQASKTNRCVYMYKFLDGAIYIGLSCNHKRRDFQHRESGPVWEYSQRTMLEIPPMIQLTEYIDYRDAAEIETSLIDRLRTIDKIVLLNKERGGGLGTWKVKEVTKDECIKNIEKCSSKTELRHKFYPSYLYLKNHLNEMEDEYIEFFLSNSRYSKVVSFNKNGEFYKIFNKIADAVKECGSKQISDACREHYLTNGYYFMYYQDWLKAKKPLKIMSHEERQKIGHKIRVEKCRERYAREGNPQTGKKKSIICRIKKSIPLVMTDLNGNFIDVLYGASFAIEKYNLSPKLGDVLYKVRDNPLKSAYGYRWYTIDFYNKTFNKNIKL